MFSLRNVPIRQKLLLITVATTATALLLAGLGIVLADSVLFRGFLQRDLSALAMIVADNSTASLAFNDPDSATQTLGALRARTHVDGACIYRSDGTILANYARQGVFVCPRPEQLKALRFSADGITVSQPIILNGRRLGTLMLLYDLGEINERIRLYSATVAGVLLADTLIDL